MSRSPASSDDEAPEAFSFTSSKKTAQNDAKALQEFHAEEKQKLKDRRRQRDRTLKERKVQAKNKGKARAKAEEDESEEEEDEGPKAGGSASREELEARMERAMREAEGESQQDEENESREDEEDEDIDMNGASAQDSSEEGEDEEDEEEEEDESLDEDAEMDSGSDDEEQAPQKPKRSSIKESAHKKDYLPDHLFASAFSHLAPSPAESKTKLHSRQLSASPPPKKRKRTKNGSRDTVIGSRVVRTLPSRTERPSTITPRALTAPGRVNRFVNRQLNVRGNAKDAKVRGWERKPAHIGVMKRHGPAAQFVRDSDE